MEKEQPTSLTLFIIGFITEILIAIGNFVLYLLAIIGSCVMNLFLVVHNILSGLGKLATSSFFFGVRILSNVIKMIGNFKFNQKKKVKSQSKKNAQKSKLVFFILGLCVAGIMFLIYSGFIFIKSLPNPRLIGIVNYPVSTQILDRKGRLLYEIHREQNRTPVKINNLPDHVWQSTIAIEDKNFFSHNGVSVVNGILRAGRDSLKTGRVQGGSTITQQLIKTSLLTPVRTIERKTKEIILALWAEHVYSKEQILEMYLNQVPYGGASYGIEAASSTFFGKHASELTISQSAFLAGLPQSPTTYSPYTNPKLSLGRRNDVLKAMLKQGYITKSQFNEAIGAPLGVRDPNTYIKAPHFVFYVKNQLEKMFGIRAVEEGGLRVVTSLDLDLQNKIEEILRGEIDSLSELNVTNGAVVVTRPEVGEIMAMVGSYDYFIGPYGSYNVTTAQRQPGSSIKPIMYSLALSKGYTSASIIDDSPIVFGASESTPYAPVNYDGKYHGKVTLRQALANSYNVPAVKVLNTLGVENFITHATNMGISTLTEKNRYGLSITLGGAEVQLVDMAVAYGVFANYGKRVDLESVINVTDFQDRQLYRSNSVLNTKRVLADGVAFIISNILSDNKARESAFGSNSQLEIPGVTVAVKTGTTNSKRDNLTIGYTKSFLTAVWVGNNNNSPMDPQLTSGVTGAAPIWNKVMTYILTSDWGSEFDKTSDFFVPDSVVQKKCFFNQPEYFIKGTEEGIGCQLQHLLTPTSTVNNY